MKKQFRLTRATEQVLELLYARGWAAEVAYRLGLQRPVSLESHEVVVNCDTPALPQLRIAFASDFHVGPCTHPHVVVTACNALRAAKPDILLLGGDFVSLHAKDINGLSAQLGGIPAPLGRFAVLGNHDILADRSYIISQLESADIHVLVNRNIRLPAPYAHIWVCGLDDFDEGFPEPLNAFKNADGVRIVLMHSPEGLRDIFDQPFDLALCGHTHGGQVALPNGQPIYMPSGLLNRRYPYGRFPVGRNGQSTLIVSRGVGCDFFPIRLFADPDVLICTLSCRVPPTENNPT